MPEHFVSPQFVVLDASVAVKLVTQEEDSEKAHSFLMNPALGYGNILVPALFSYEFCSALLDSKGFSEEQLRKALEYIELLSLKTFNPDNNLQYEAAKLLKKFNISFYDASYLALAVQYKADFITADEKLIKKVGDKLTFVRSLYNYPYLPKGGRIMAEEQVGKVMDYFAKVGVAGILLEGTLKVGDTIHIKGHTSDLTFTVDSLQIDRKPVPQAGKNDTIGIKVSDRVRPGDVVYLVKP